MGILTLLVFDLQNLVHVTKILLKIYVIFQTLYYLKFCLMNLKENKYGALWKRLERGKGRRKLCDYNFINERNYQVRKV